VRSGGGVLHWFPGKDRFTRYASEHGLPGNSVCAAAVDGSGQVWVSGEQLGLYYLKNDIWQLYGILGEVKVSYLTTDSTGKLWVGTANDIYAIALDNYFVVSLIRN
jgi:ligand-binding sensor domain-containing protein